MHPCSHHGDTDKVHAIVTGVQRLYAVRAMADEKCSSIDEAVERFKYMQLDNHARVVAWLEGLISITVQSNVTKINVNAIKILMRNHLV